MVSPVLVRIWYTCFHALVHNYVCVQYELHNFNSMKFYFIYFKQSSFILSTYEITYRYQFTGVFSSHMHFSPYI